MPCRTSCHRHVWKGSSLETAFIVMVGEGSDAWFKRQAAQIKAMGMQHGLVVNMMQRVCMQHVCMQHVCIQHVLHATCSCDAGTHMCVCITKPPGRGRPHLPGVGGGGLHGHTRGLTHATCTCVCMQHVCVCNMCVYATCLCMQHAAVSQHVYGHTRGLTTCARFDARRMCACSQCIGAGGDAKLQRISAGRGISWCASCSRSAPSCNTHVHSSLSVHAASDIETSGIATSSEPPCPPSMLSLAQRM